jgi:O-antigen ligase
MLKYLFFLSVFTLSLGQFAKIGEPGGANLYLFDLAVGLYSIVGIFYLLTIKKLIVRKNKLLFLIFTFIAITSLIWNANRLSNTEFLSAFSYLLRWVSYLLASIVTYNLVKIGKISQEALLKTFIFSGLFISLAGFLQLVLLPDFTVLDPSLGWDPHKNRLASTFFDPNFTGAYLSLIFTFTLLSNERRKKIYLFIMGLAIFLTYSRSTWGALGIVVLIYGWQYSKKLIFLALTIAFLAYFAVPRIQTRLAGITDPADSAHFRLISWRNTLEIAQDNLFLGVGYNSFKKSQIDYGFLAPGEEKEHSATGSDSSFLLILATTGIIGLLIFSLGYFFPLFSGNFLLVLLLIPLFFQSQFINALFFPQIMFFWLNAATFKKLKS